MSGGNEPSKSTGSEWDYKSFDKFYHDPKTRSTHVLQQRLPETKIFGTRGEYLTYVRRPLSEIALEVPKQPRILWESSAQELASAATLLPQYPLHNAGCYPSKAEEINRTKYRGRNREEASWYFNASYSKDKITVKFVIREIDLVGIHRYTEKRDAASLALTKELYLLNFFFHENLLHSLFTISEPSIFRMNIGLPRFELLSTLAKKFDLIEGGHGGESCNSISYVSVCLLRAVDFLHSKNIAHKFISIGSAVVDERGNIKVGGFSKVETFTAVQAFEAKASDVWSIGITVLDYLFGVRREFYKIFSSPSSINCYESLFAKILRLSAPKAYRHVRDYDDDRFYAAQGDLYTHVYPEIESKSSMWKFIDACTQESVNIPSADWLLENHPFVRFDEAEFKRVRRDFVEKVQSYGFKIEPLYNQQKITDKLQYFNTRRIMNSFYSSAEAPIEGHLPASLYDNKEPDDDDNANDFPLSSTYPLRNCVLATESSSHIKIHPKNPNPIQFKTDSNILVSFLLHCDFYDPPPRHFYELVVGEEASMFGMFFELLKVRQQNYIKNTDSINNRDWHFINNPGQLYFPWDVFRLRRALFLMLSEARTFEHDQQTGIITKSRTFVLCNHKSKLPRAVEIQIRASREQLINTFEIEYNRLS